MENKLKPSDRTLLAAVCIVSCLAGIVSLIALVVFLDV